MHPISDLALSALSGSRVDDRVVATVWYGGEVVVQELPVSKWSIDADGGAQVQRRVQLDVTDVDGKLAPWALNDPLGVGGPRIHLSYRFGGQGYANEIVDLGRFRTTASSPVQRWRKYDLPSGDHEIRWVSSGATIPVTAQDLTQVAKAARFMAPESPPAGATVVSEVRRLLTGIMPVTVAAGVVDVAIPTASVFETERMDAVDDLVDRIACAYRMTGDGQLEIYPTAATTPVWEIAGAEGGALIELQQSQSVDGLYNAAVVEGMAGLNGLPLRKIVTEDDGPLRWNGPHWQVPLFYSSSLLATQAQVDAEAARLLAGRIQDRTVTLNIECLPNPALQVGDTVRVLAPSVSGSQVPLDGVVRTFRLSGSTEGVDTMTMTVECPYDVVQAVVHLLRAPL